MDVGLHVVVGFQLHGWFVVGVVVGPGQRKGCPIHVLAILGCYSSS